MGVDAQSFAQIAAAAFTPRPVPVVGTEHLHAPQVSVPEQAERLLEMLERRGVGQWASFSRSGRRLRRADPDRRAVPGAARAVPGPGGSIRAVRTAWCAPDFVDRRPAGERRAGQSRVGRRAELDHDRRSIRSRPAVSTSTTTPSWTTTSSTRVLEALLLVVDTPVSAETLATVDRAAGASHHREAASGWPSEFTRPRQRHRPAGGRRRLADVHPRRGSPPTSSGCCSTASRSKLTRAALETLAVVAYRQPVTRARVSAVRGVNVDAVIRTLVARGLITEAGTDADYRRDDVRHHRAVPRAPGAVVADRPARHRAAAARRRRDRRPERNPGQRAAFRQARRRARRPDSPSPSMWTEGRWLTTEGRATAESVVAGRNRLAAGRRADDPRRPGRGRRHVVTELGTRVDPDDRRHPGRRRPDRARRLDGLPGDQQAPRHALDDVRRPGPALHRRPGRAPGARQQEAVPRRAARRRHRGTAAADQRRRIGAPADAPVVRGAQDLSGDGDRFGAPRVWARRCAPGSNSTTARSRWTTSPWSTPCPARRWCG